MSSIAAVSGGSPAGSPVAAVLSHLTRRLARGGVPVTPIELHEYSATDALADPADPPIVEALRGADAVVVVEAVPSPEPVAALLRLLPPSVLHGTPALAVVVGDAAAQPSGQGRVDQQLLRLGAVPVAATLFVPAAHLTVFPDGGVLIEPASAVAIADAASLLLTAAGRPGRRPAGTGIGRVSPVAGAPDLTTRRVRVGDVELQPLLDELMVEYGTRYGRISPYTELTEVPASDFEPPAGAFLVLTEDGDSVAGGAIRRYDDRTAEVKRVWTSSRHRRRGLARRVMAELEQAAVELGYQRIHLTTGPRQPEAKALYLAAGYQPRFDVAADPESIGPLAFAKELVPGAGLPEWEPPTTAEALAQHGLPTGAVR